MARELRPYQQDAVNAVIDYWSTPGLDRYTPVVVAATGLGKSTIIAALAVKAARLGSRVVMLAHRGELLRQMIDTVGDVAPGEFTTGIVQAENDDHHAQIVAASFQTLASSPARLEQLKDCDVVLVDECHHSLAPTYLDVLTALGVGTPGTVACGFTATLQRTDDDLGKLWDKVVFERSISWAIKNGYLVTPRGLVVVMPELDKLRDVTIRAGDFAPGELDGVMSASVETVADAVEHHASDRRLIVFVPGVDSCLELANALSARGIAAAPVTGATPRDERERIYSAYRDGRLQALITVQVLTEGADFPMCDCVVIARPTRSQTLYVQMIGRAIRQYDGKHDALVLDLAGTTLDKKLKTLSSLGLGNDAPVKRVAVDSDEDPGQDEPPAPVERVERIGAVQVMPVDLLGSSTATWLKTKLGVPFLDIGGGSLVAIFQMNENSYQAAAFTNRGRLLEQSTPTTSLSDALELGESIAGKYGVIPDNGAAWRRKGPPSAAQISMALSLGIDDAENKTRARLSDDISTALASKTIDRLFR